MNIGRIKQAVMIFLACVVSVIIFQLAFPFILGVLVNGLSFITVFWVYDLVVRKKLRIRLDWATGNDGEPHTEKNRETEHSTKEPDRERKGTDRAEPGGKDTNSAEETEQKLQVLKWYQERGRERFQSMIAAQYAKGIYECWIRQDGICNVKTEKGFRRAGSLPGYPGEFRELIAEVMRQDGLNVVVQKKYLYVSWAED